MRRPFLLSTMLIAASFIFISCNSSPSNTNNANATVNTNVNTAPSAAASEADIKRILGDLSAALSKNDTAALDKIYADDYEFVAPDGQIQTKAQRLDSMRSGELKMESITFDDPHIRLYGDAAVVTAKTTQKSTNKGKDVSGSAVASIVFVRTKDGWRVVHGAPTTPVPAGKTATTPAAANAIKPAANTAPANKPAANAPANKPAANTKTNTNQ